MVATSHRMSALNELQIALLPAAIGTCAIIYSTISGIFVVSKIRYADKDFKHPFKPWLDSHSASMQPEHCTPEPGLHVSGVLARR